ncbi:DUF2442 domain-containing protein [uncultured Alistipes sp.]|uniref:DUF2442 domain-containing protein n=1 Tax=uncultured Alistipes sp. TaxID=538949 RepID=UPI002582767C|nr:DUF2442 domain-containing protein [uncultured Alistipes sp.]
MEKITKVWFDGGRICVATDDGKIYGRPLEYFPILKEATDEQRGAWKINRFGDAIRWEEIDEDIHLSSFYDTEEPDADNVIGDVFRRFPQLNVSEVARTIGIHKSLLSKYIYGSKKTSERRTAEILDTLRQIGRDLAQIHG